MLMPLVSMISIYRLNIILCVLTPTPTRTEEGIMPIMASHWRRPGWIAPPPMAVFAFMLIWLVIGMSGSMALLGADAIANGAHVGGLVAGWVLGLLVSSAPALFRKS